MLFVIITQFKSQVLFYFTILFLKNYFMESAMLKRLGITVLDNVKTITLCLYFVGKKSLAFYYGVVEIETDNYRSTHIG